MMMGLRLEYSFVLACTLLACAEEPALQPTAARSALTSGAWTIAELIPAFQYPVLASLDDRVVLVAQRVTPEWSAGTDNVPLDMWEWNGSAWASRRSAHSPTGRVLPGLALVRDKLVLFGGYTRPDRSRGAQGYLADTWEWDGVDWTERAPRAKPIARNQMALASWQGRALLFGGQNDRGTLTDTWVWNGSAWAQQQPSHAPPPCDSPAAALGDTVVLFCSARDAADHAGHTWEWGGSDWSERTPDTRPSSRYFHTLASFGDRVVMFGGYADSGNSQETWVWDGADWTDVSVQPSPPARDGYRTARLGAELVLYGGGTNETWAWNGTAWRIVAPAAMPPARNDYAFSAVGDKVILFGGCCKPGARVREYWDDTWQWDGARWTQLAPAHSPPARAATTLTAIDDHSALLFGGVAASGELADTWQWDATSNDWIERTPADSPPARQRHALGSLSDRVLLYGGANAAGALGDTWEWHDDTWRRLHVDTAPEPGFDHALGRYGSSLILVTGDFERSWRWDGSAWSLLAAETVEGPLARPIHVATLATSEGQRLVAWGNVTAYLQTTLQWDGIAWRAFPTPPTFRNDFEPARPLAAMGDTLVTLSGSPERTAVYQSP